jgi:4-diphosphocytidyl-2-C-methyl-D-erythritol kinase
MLKNAISLSVMLLLSPAKINLGLFITERRKDGYHNLQSVMVPIGLCDILEILPLPGDRAGIRFTQTGIGLDSGPGENLCERAYEAMSKWRRLPPVSVHLHKLIPAGAGLGGGSSNAGMMLKGLNRLLEDPLPVDDLHRIAAGLGSDCPFFLYGEPMMMEGRGDILSPFRPGLEDSHLAVFYAGIHISTGDAYRNVVPVRRTRHLREEVRLPLSKWIKHVVNDFEKPVFDMSPVLRKLKEGLYGAGALYASLSGSGSAVYGIFNEKPDLPPDLSEHLLWDGKAGVPNLTV